LNGVKTLLWFLKRPRLYPELARRTLRKLARDDASDEASRAEALDWYESLAVETEQALELVLGVRPVANFRERHQAELDAAEQRARACPVKMGGAGNLELLFHLCEGLAATRVIETGVAAGWSSLALLLALEPRPDARLVSVDMPYPLRDGDAFVGCVVPERLRARWSLLAWPDREGLPRALEQLPEIDLCHYDSDKSRAGRAFAYPRLWAALRPGGLFLSDDVGDDSGFRDFCRKLGRSPIVVRSAASDGAKYVGILVKPDALNREATARRSAT
jgi:methyltransferase family protein